eukprot:scaffold9122_cov94-Cylindrotheca_fusiformis.AAC.1
MRSPGLPELDAPLQETNNGKGDNSGLSRLEKLRAKHDAVRRASGYELQRSKERLANGFDWYSKDFNTSGRKFFLDDHQNEKSTGENDSRPEIQRVPLHVALKKENEKLRLKLEKLETRRQSLRRQLSSSEFQNVNTEKAILATQLREANARYTNLELELEQTKEALAAKDTTTMELLDEMQSMRAKYDSLSLHLKSKGGGGMLKKKEQRLVQELEAKIAELEEENKELLLEKALSSKVESEPESEAKDDRIARVQRSMLSMFRTNLSMSSAKLTSAQMEIMSTIGELRDTRDALEDAQEEIEILRREKKLLMEKVKSYENGSRNLAPSLTNSPNRGQSPTLDVFIQSDDSYESRQSSSVDPDIDYDLTSVDPDDTSVPDGADFEDEGGDVDADNDEEMEYYLQDRMKQVIFTQAIRSLGGHDVNLVNQVSIFFTAVILIFGHPLLGLFFSSLGIFVYMIQKDQTLSVQKDTRKFFLVNCAASLASLSSWLLMVRALGDLERPLKFAFATLVREMMGVVLAGFLFVEYRNVESDPETALDIIEVRVTILEGRGLVAKDKNIFGRSTTSDPYVKIYHANNYIGKTAIIWKTLNPLWKGERFCITAIPNVLDSYDVIECNVYDHDTLSQDDAMGTVHIPIPRQFNEKVSMWYPVEKGKGGDYCWNATGELHVEVEVQPRLSTSFKSQLQRMSSIQDIARSTFRGSNHSSDSPQLQVRENGRKRITAPSQGAGESKHTAGENAASVIRI